ncbi:MAG: hypothetical protein JAZ17_16390 [Candidatus Thiodiazotropha endolucinida]|nr:hypothetical protein [Candidatus Thiodiazotropha endolucinida]
MGNVIYLKKGAVYFYVGFMDENLKIPNIQTWVYVRSDQEHGHVFESTSGSNEQFCFPDGISSNILDHKALSGWLLEEHSPKKVGKKYEYRAIKKNNETGGLVNVTVRFNHGDKKLTEY